MSIFGAVSIAKQFPFSNKMHQKKKKNHIFTFLRYLNQITGYIFCHFQFLRLPESENSSQGPKIDSNIILKTSRNQQHN